jgi:hypothetical protein
MIRLIGSEGNRNAFGARVKVVSGDLAQIDECRSGGSYISQNDTRLHFGLEQRTQVDRITVHWPGGKVENVTGVPTNRFVTITQGRGITEIRRAKK